MLENEYWYSIAVGLRNCKNKLEEENKELRSTLLELIQNVDIMISCFVDILDKLNLTEEDKNFIVKYIVNEHTKATQGSKV